MLDDMPGGAEVTYFGGWAVAVRGVPADRPLRVLGERMDPAGPDAARWHSVWVECLPGEPVRSVPSGYVLVDEAKLMFADPAALNEWRDEEFHDVLIDLAVGSPAEAGSIEVGGALMTGWFTSWGDGAYPVYRDLGRDGELLRVRVELGAPEIVRLRRALERRWFGDLAQLAIVSVRVTRDGSAIGWLYREDPDNDQDSGWRVFAGDETEEYLEDAANCVLMPLRELIVSDPALEELFDQPAPAAFEREAPDGVFVRVRPGEW